MYPPLLDCEDNFYMNSVYMLRARDYQAKRLRAAHHEAIHHPLDFMQAQTQKDDEKICNRLEINEKEEYEKVKWREYKRSYVQAVNACVSFYSPVSNKVKKHHIGRVATGHGTESFPRVVEPMKHIFFMVRVTNP
jgi:hypothetical protein